MLGILGRGGMSTVYKVAMPYTGKIVALKLMTPPELLVDLLGLAELKGLFLAEATTMAQLNHPHIADVWDVDEHRGMPFFIMEYFCNNLGTMIGEDDKAEKTFPPPQPGQDLPVRQGDSRRPLLSPPGRHCPPGHQAFQYSDHQPGYGQNRRFRTFQAAWRRDLRPAPDQGGFAFLRRSGTAEKPQYR